MTTAEIVQRLGAKPAGPSGWIARCPAHSDRTPSLSISEGNDGRILLKCFAGCTNNSIVSAMGLGMGDLFSERPRNERHHRRQEIVAEYVYRNETGAEVFQVCRLNPKSFRQRHRGPNGDWIWNMEGVERVIYRLPEVLDAVAAGRTVFICEGEKDCDALKRIGFVATCNSGGAGKWRQEYSKPLEGAEVAIIADKDKQGRDHAQSVASRLHGIAASIRVLELPDFDGRTVKDAHDWIAAGGEASELDELVQAVPLWTPTARASTSDGEPAETLKSDLPMIQLPGDDRLLSAFAEEVGATVCNADIYARNGLVYLMNPAGTGLEPMEAITFMTWCEKFFVGFRVRQNITGQILRRTMSQSNAEGVLAAPQFIAKLRHVERFNPVRMPAMTNGGPLTLLPEGYDLETRTLTRRGAVTFDTTMSIADARAVIDDLLSEFGFADAGRSKAVAISAMLTVFGRLILPANSLRPCFIYLANAEGAGKTLLVKLAAVPVIGAAPASCCPHDEEEMRKLLLSAVLEMRNVILLDNYKGRLSSEALEGFITAQQWSGRVLGGNKTFTGANDAVVFITGNGATVSPDMRRRALFAELFMAEERAEDRKFKRQMEVPFLLERRQSILSALFAMFRHWHELGQPKASRSHSSFPEWTDIIGGTVEACGFACPVDTPTIEAAADVDGQDMRDLVGGILDGCTHKTVTFERLVAIAKERGLFEAMFERLETDAKGARSQFGRMLQRYDRRIIGGCRFELEGRGHKRRFKVSRLQ